MMVKPTGLLSKQQKNENIHMRKKTSFKLCSVLELGTIVNNRNIKQGKNKKEF